MSTLVTHHITRSHAREDRRAVVVAQLLTLSREHITRAMYAAGRAGDERERERLARILEADMGA